MNETFSSPAIANIAGQFVSLDAQSRFEGHLDDPHFNPGLLKISTESVGVRYFNIGVELHRGTSNMNNPFSNYT